MECLKFHIKKMYFINFIKSLILKITNKNVHYYFSRKNDLQ